MRNKAMKTILGLCVLSILLAYQNCGDTGISGSLLKSSAKSEYPFPVNMEGDFFAFMSCHGLPDDNESNNGTKYEYREEYFNFKMVSDSRYGNGGVSLAKEFLEAVEAERVLRPKSFVLSDEIEKAMDANTRLDDAQLMMSLFTVSSNSVLTNPYSSLLMSDVYSEWNFQDQDVIEMIKEQTDERPVYGLDFSGQIDIRDVGNSYLIDKVIQDLNGGVLAVGINYTNTGNNPDAKLRTPEEMGEDTISGAYGRFLLVSFKNDNPYKVKNVSEYDARVINGLNEEIDGKFTTCREVKIIRPTDQDISDSNCNTDGGWKPLILQDFAANKSLGELSLQQRALVRVIDGSFRYDSKWLFNKDQSCMVHADYLNVSSEMARHYGCYGDPFVSSGADTEKYEINYGAYNKDKSNNANYLTYCF